MNWYLILLFFKFMFSYLLKEFLYMLNINASLLYVLQNLFSVCGFSFSLCLLGLLMYRHLKLQGIHLYRFFFFIAYIFFGLD